MRLSLTTAHLRWVVAGLMVAAAGLFAVGVAMESSNEESHANEQAETEPDDESNESSEEGESEEGESEEGESEEDEEQEETVFGIDAESPLIVATAILVSLLLALGVASGWRPVPIVTIVALVAVLFAGFDLREVLRKLDEDETAIAAVAGAVALLHFGAAAAAALLLRRSSDTV